MYRGEDNIKQAPAAASVAPGYLLASRYELIQAIAYGGMAQVWVATDQTTNTSVAIKVLHPHLANDQKFIDRFQREARAAVKLKHPSIVAIRDQISSNGVEAIVMELIEGRTLRDELDEKGRLSPSEVISIGSSLADGLAVAHRAGIIHRDIKPANIMMTKDGNTVITDFGIAKAKEDTDLTATGMLLGTAKYLAPEQVTGKDADARSDLYSLAVVMFEALTGFPPFDAESEAATALARIQSDAPRISHSSPELQGELDEVIAKAMARDPKQRYRSARDFNTALQKIDQTRIGDPSTSARVESSPASESSMFANEQASDASPLTNPIPQSKLIDQKNVGPLSTNWVIPITALVLILFSIGLVSVLMYRALTQLGDSSVAIERAGIYDPTDNDVENNEELALATDNDLNTSWRTESYLDSDLRTSKDLFGPAFRFSEPQEISEVEISSPSSNYTLEVYAFSTESGEFSERLGLVTESDGTGTTTIDLDSNSSQILLISITDTGTTEGQNQFLLSEISFK